MFQIFSLKLCLSWYYGSGNSPKDSLPPFPQNESSNSGQEEYQLIETVKF